jgi:hypothetical protein
LTVTAGGSTVLPSSGLESTKLGVIGVAGVGADASEASATSCKKADMRICSPAVPLTEATLPASVEMSYVAVAPLGLAPAEAESQTTVTAAARTAGANVVNRFRILSPFVV